MSVTICPENFEYRAEGNAGIVIRLLKEGTVLRLKKYDENRSIPDASESLLELESNLKIIENIWEKLLGEPFVNKPDFVFLKAEEIRIINKKINELRPVQRRHKNVKEVDSYVCMLPDYCSIPSNLKPMPMSGPVLCVEIKPKQGFMKEDFFQTNFKTLPVPMCHYCMMQALKMKRGAIASESAYCPLDLFSGCQNRMVHALKMLIKTPQNNLRIFKDQKLIYSEERRSDLNELLSDFVPFEGVKIGDLLADLILQALVKPFPFGMENAPIISQNKFPLKCLHSHSIACSESESSHKLPLYSVLERVYSIQLLDDLNIIDLYHLYRQVIQNREQGTEFIGCYSRTEIPPHIGKFRKVLNETEYQYASRKVWEFLNALVMKDCSIMVTFRRLNSNSAKTIGSQNVISDKYGNSYVFSIAIADLDAKSLAKVEKVYNDVTAMLESLDSFNDD